MVSDPEGQTPLNTNPAAWLATGVMDQIKGRGGEASISLFFVFGCSLRRPAM